MGNNWKLSRSGVRVPANKFPTKQFLKLNSNLLDCTGWSRCGTKQNVKNRLKSSSAVQIPIALVFKELSLSKTRSIHWTISFSWLTWPREVEMLSSHQPRYLGIAPSTTRYINFLENETWDNWTCTTRWSCSFSKSLSCNVMEKGLIEIACVNSTYP